MSLVGRSFLLQLHLSGDDYQTLAGQMVTSFTISNQQIDVTDKDDSRWRKLMEGAPRELELSGQGLVNDDSAFDLLRGYAAAGTIARYRVTFSTGQTLDAKMQVVSLDADGEYDGAQSYSLSLASADEVAYAAPDPDSEGNGGNGAGGGLLILRFNAVTYTAPLGDAITLRFDNLTYTPPLAA